jgi:hypothetical protein
VSEADAQPLPDTSFSRLDVGVLITLTSLAIAAVAGLIAVLDADNSFSAIGIGFGVAVLIVQGGATIACALACLVRHRLEVLSLVGLAAVGLFVDLLVLAIWLDIESEAYGKLVGVAGVWSFVALSILGLTLAAQPRDPLARWLYLAAVGTSLLGGFLASVLIVDAGADDFVPSGPSAFGIEPLANESVLRPLGAVFVVNAALWFAALAASRVERLAGD